MSGNITVGGIDYPIDIFANSSAAKSPAVVVLHGNFGLAGNIGTMLRDFAEQVRDAGFTVALPSYYPRGDANLEDIDAAAHVPVLKETINQLSQRADTDITRLGIIGFSLGAGVASYYFNDASSQKVKAFADFYGYVAPTLALGVSKYPPTIVFHNLKDPVVRIKENSYPLVEQLDKAGIANEHSWVTDDWVEGWGHVFEPGGQIDFDTRRRSIQWMQKYV